jgi:acyl-CoA synthetase (NDP forming)
VEPDPRNFLRNERSHGPYLVPRGFPVLRRAGKIDRTATATGTSRVTSTTSAFLRPQSVALVGAGDRLTSSGGAVLRNLLRSGFRGRIVPVNPKGGALLGLPVARSLTDVSPPCELVVIVVRADSVLDVAREAAASGHRNLLILPGGFAESGVEGKARDRELRALAQQHGLTIGGPNCAGSINLLDASTPFAATFLRDMPRGGGVALVSQSGAIAEEVIASSHSLGIPLGAVVSVGNAVHLGLTEYLDQLGADPACRAILLYAESFGDMDRFREVARLVSKRKPVVALAGGRTQEGRDAALRHTGSESLTDGQAERFCVESGMVRATSLRRLMLAGKAFGAHPRGIGRRVLVLSNSGGPGVLCTDQSTLEGLELPALPAALRARLTGFLPLEASVANPLDLLADAREDRFGDTLAAALEHGGIFDAILIIHVVPFMVDGGAVVARLADLCRDARLPILHSMMGTLEHKGEWSAAMEAAGVPMFDDVEDMAQAAGLLARYRALHASAG